MKTTMLLLALASLGVSSCKTVSVVANRDNQGRYVTPVCPIDNEAFTDSATVYRHSVNGATHYGVSTWNEGSSTEAPTIKAVK